MDRSMGLLIIVAGVLIIVVGLLIYSGGLSWFGRLPGDIRYRRGGVSVYIPIVSMLLISLALTLIFSLLSRFF
jgi:di/tricarboxylate transporter